MFVLLAVINDWWHAAFFFSSKCFYLGFGGRGKGFLLTVWVTMPELGSVTWSLVPVAVQPNSLQGDPHADIQHAV